MDETVELLQSFNFVVRFTGEGALGKYTGAFAECSGLEVEADIKEYLEGGYNNGVRRRVGRVKLQQLVLKRGMFAVKRGEGTVDSALWDWLGDMVAGRLPIPRYDGMVIVKDRPQGREMATWHFVRGLPAKVTGPTLNAKTGEIAVEELRISHEGLRLGGRP